MSIVMEIDDLEQKIYHCKDLLVDIEEQKNTILISLMALVYTQQLLRNKLKDD